MRLSLNVLLLREGLSPLRAVSQASLDVGQFLKWADGRVTPLDSATLRGPSSGDVIVLLLRRPTGVPSWQRFIETALALPTLGAPTDSLGAVLFCGVSGPGGSSRWLAWCFGAGSRAMRRSSADPRFGLLTALNTLVTVAIDSRGDAAAPRSRRALLRNFEYQTTSPYFQRTRHRASRDIPVTGFRFDRESDLVSLVGGKSDDDRLGDVLGGRALRFRATLETIEDLVSLSRYVHAASQEVRYQEEFSWVDRVTPVFEEDLIETLHADLMDRLLADPIPPTVDVLVPDDLVGLDDERAIHYIAYPRKPRRSASDSTFTVAMVAALLRKAAGPSARREALNTELRFLDASRDLIGAATVLECLCADIRRSDGQYALYDGDYYRVDSDFVESIDTELMEIPESDLQLPCYQGGSEPSYNDNVCACGEELLVLDRVLIRIPGEYGVEACDLVATTGALIHVKKKGKSSVLSHLFLQAQNSCELLSRSAEARDLLVGLVDGADAEQGLKRRAIEAVAQAGVAPEHPVDYAFLGDWRDRTITSLPLFSRIAFVQAARRLRTLHFSPAYKLVDICR